MPHANQCLARPVHHRSHGCHLGSRHQLLASKIHYRSKTSLTGAIQEANGAHSNCHILFPDNIAPDSGQPLGLALPISTRHNRVSKFRESYLFFFGDLYYLRVRWDYHWLCQSHPGRIGSHQWDHVDWVVNGLYVFCVSGNIENRRWAWSEELIDNLCV